MGKMSEIEYDSRQVSSLVSELRSYPQHYVAANRAADRIEQLEAALRQICDGPRDADKSYAELFAEVCWEARAALREKKDGNV